MERDILANLNPIFYPRGIAIVGASRNNSKPGHKWLKGLITRGFPGGLYVVNPGEEELLGVKSYSNLRDIPGPVDLVIVCIPRRFALPLLDDCSARGVKAVHFFTAGFRETGKPEDAALEWEMLRKARMGDFRIIGPNCIGVYHPEARMPWGPSDLLGEPGAVGFISQSGGQAGKMAELGLGRDIRFSKVVSYGNGVDLSDAELLEYLCADPNTEVIGGYLEGTNDGRLLFKTMQKVARRKPLIIWKGGRTQVGAEIASSHTGSLAASTSVWSAALRQAGVVEAQTLEELADTILLFQNAKSLSGKAVTVICGLADGGGGESVLAGDACTAAGLDMPSFSHGTRNGLRDILGEIGSVLRNPVDVSQGSSDVSKVKQALDLITAEDRTDMIVIYENTDILERFTSRGTVYAMNDAFVEFNREQDKPLVIVLPSGSAEDLRLEAERKFSREGIAVFPSMERAARAIGNVHRYSVQHAES